MNQIYSELNENFFKAHGTSIVTNFGIDYPKGTYKWIPTDSKDRFKDYFEQSVKEDDPILKKTIQFYRRNPIEYRLNECSFRDEPLDSKPKEVDVYLGCSFTFGIGLHREHIWATKLQEYLNFPSINAAVPGHGPITAYRILVMLNKRFKIRNVFYFSVLAHSRFEWYKTNFKKLKDGTEGGYFVNRIPSDPFVTEEMVENLFTDRNTALLYHSIHHAIEGLCNLNGIQFYPTSNLQVHDYLYFPRIKETLLPEFEPDPNILDIASRDITHYSLVRNHYIFLWYLKLLGEKISKENIPYKLVL